MKNIASFGLFILHQQITYKRINCWILLSFMVRYLDDIWKFYGISNLSCIQVLHRDSLLSSIANSRLLSSKIALTIKVIRFWTNIPFSDKQKNIPSSFKIILYSWMRPNDSVPKNINIFNFCLNSHRTIDMRRLAFISKLRASEWNDRKQREKVSSCYRLDWQPHIVMGILCS